MSFFSDFAALLLKRCLIGNEHLQISLAYSAFSLSLSASANGYETNKNPIMDPKAILIEFSTENPINSAIAADSTSMCGLTTLHPW